jgi:branched-subunit amino acid aminotransferase/4-amino-4-deoxychorismate lyase
MDDFALYGYSVFETLRAKRGTFWRWESHWQRLHASAEAVDLAAPDRKHFLDILRRAHDETSDQVLRVALLKQGGRWSDKPAATRSEVLVRPCGSAPDNLLLMPVPDPLPNADNARQYKTGSRLFYELWAARARVADAQDALFFDEEGGILETSTGNIFLDMDGRWLTPPRARGVLPGIAREWVLESGLAEEANLYREDLKHARGVFVTNAVHGIQRVAAIGDIAYSAQSTLRLDQRLGERVFSPLPRLP